MKIRELIKNILKEESYNKETKRGIDIAIKILKQDFPYIIGSVSYTHLTLPTILRV